MYCFDGIIYRIWGCGGSIALLGIICLLLSHSWRPSRDKRGTVIGIVLVVLAILISLFYLWRLSCPEVEVFDGTYLSENRNSRVAPPLPFTMCYNFSQNDDSTKSVYLDIISKKNIYQPEFTPGVIYRVYYDKITKIIVMVEAISAAPQ